MDTLQLSKVLEIIDIKISYINKIKEITLDNSKYMHYEEVINENDHLKKMIIYVFDKQNNYGVSHK